MLELVVELCKSLYVDDLISGKLIVWEVREFKEGVILIFVDVKFRLYKWYLNVVELEELEG